MKRKLATTLAITVGATQINSVAFADIINEDVESQDLVNKEKENNNDDTKVTDESVANNSAKDDKEETKDKIDNTTETETEDEVEEVDKNDGELEDRKEDVENHKDNETNNQSSNESTNYEPKGKLEIDLNFAMPIKIADSEITDISVKLSNGSDIGTIKLGSDVTTGKIEGSDITYTVEALDGAKKQLEEKAKELRFYHITFENLPLGTYSVELGGAGYNTTAVNDIEIQISSKRVRLGTTDREVIIDDKGNDDPSDDIKESYPGVFLAGNVDGEGLVTEKDYDVLKAEIKKNSKVDLSNNKYDLNRDGKIDITDLSYVHGNLKKTSIENVIIEDTDAIINPENVEIKVSESVQVTGDVKNILRDADSIVSLSPKQGEISKENPIDLPINLPEPVKMEQVVIEAPVDNGPGEGAVIVKDVNGNVIEKPFNRSNTRVLGKSINGKQTEGIVVNLGSQVAVSEITIKVTGGRGNKNLAEIAKVEFVNNVYKETPKPKMDIPVINNFTSATAVGKEFMEMKWDHQSNVTGYEVKVEELNDKGEVASKLTYKTSENKLKIEKVNPYVVYRVSIQSLSGDEWKSGYKDEQENYNKDTVGDTNLLTNKNDKDGKPDNADKNYIPQAWDSKTGILNDKANATVDNAYNDELKGANNYGADSIIEFQVIPETAPEGPEGISATGLYKGLQINWKEHKKAKDYDIYYRKIGTDSWTKANDPTEPKYIDSDLSNDIPDGVKDLKPDEKKDHDELIRGTSYTINDLEDNATYEIKMTATNHHGTGGLSQTYLGATVDLTPPNTPNYKLINIPKENGGVNHIESVEMVKNNAQLSNNDPMSIVDNDYTTTWVLQDWDAGVYYGQRAPIINFDKEYTFDTIRYVTKLENSSKYPLPWEAKVRIYDKNAEEYNNPIEVINNGQLSVTHKNAPNGVKYVEIKLPKPITAKKVEVNVSGGRDLSISEMKFYHYDSLENDVEALYSDNLKLQIKEDVTQEKIDELVERAKTMDSATMEYHPNQKTILEDLKRIQELYDDVNLKDRIKVLNARIRNAGNTIGQANNWQALGVAVKPGDEINIYIGSERADTKFKLGISQHYGESGTAFKEYNQELKVGKNTIVVPHTGFDMDYEKGGNLYLKFERNYRETERVQVRVSGGTELPHLDLNNGPNQQSTESEMKDKIRTYIRELKTYVRSLPDRYPATVTAEDKVNNIYTYNPETSILNSTEIEGDRIMLSLPATQILAGIEEGLGGNEDAEVNRLYENMQAWEQFMQVSYAQQGLLEKAVDFNGDGKIDDTKLDELGGKSENEYFNSNRAPLNRMNIKYQRMFTGAFMYASGHHVGIGYGSAKGMMQGVPFKYDENGNLTNKHEGQYFGWGIGHEVGHVHDVGGLTYAETTNNILSLIAQTFDDEDTSNLEDNGYKEAYDKVTSGSVGLASSGNARLAMFWQLHLAYDNDYTYKMLDLNTDGDLDNDTFYSKLYRVTRIKGKAPSENGHDQTAQTFIMRSSDAVGKDLRNFFEKWGLVASPNTDKYLDEQNYPKEDKAIYYLNDEARRRRLDAIDKQDINLITMAKDTQVIAKFGRDKNGNEITEKTYLNQKEVPLTLSLTKDNDKILGYEIIRREVTTTGIKEVPVAFVERDRGSSITHYTDIIDAANNRAFGYIVKAYDYKLNVTEQVELGTVKVTHDGSIDKADWRFDTNTRSLDDIANEGTGHGPVQGGAINHIKDNDKSTVYKASKATDNNGHVTKEDPYVTIDLGQKKSVVGLKYTPPISESNKFSLKNIFKKNITQTYQPIKDYIVWVSNDNKNWTKAHSGKFDTTKENTIYFNEGGNGNNSQLWTHNVQYVRLSAVNAPSTIAIAELELLGPPGDNIEIGVDNNDQVYENGIGRLKADYQYAEGKTIPKDSIIVTGEYRGDPAFNIPLVLNENNENFALESHAILLAELPENSQLGEVAEGNWIYWITPEEQDKIINGEPNIEGTKIRAELYRYNKLDSNNAPVGQRLVSDTFMIDLPESLDNLPEIELSGGQGKNRKSDNKKVIEINQDVMKKVFENR